jgi:hypothetical protein
MTSGVLHGVSQVWRPHLGAAGYNKIDRCEAELEVVIEVSHAVGLVVVVVAAYIVAFNLGESQILFDVIGLDSIHGALMTSAQNSASPLPPILYEKMASFFPAAAADSTSIYLIDRLIRTVYQPSLLATGTNSL